MPDEASIESISELFGRRLLCVPDYQRGYAWDDAQRQDLIDDLETLSRNSNHYTGTVVLHPRADGRVTSIDGTALQRFDIVDGQQRLTTLVVLLSAMRREFLSLPGRAPLAQGIQATFISVVQLETGLPVPKLRLHGSLGDFFEQAVLGDGHANVENIAQERLLRAKAQFVAWIAAQKAALGGAFEPWLLELYLKVSQCLRVTRYQVGSQAEVGVIFEVMNNRGKPLSELEKVKNYLLYLAGKINVPGHDLAARVNRIWARLLRRMMAARLIHRGQEDRLLRMHWLLAVNPDPKGWDGSNTIKQHLLLKDHRGDHKGLLHKIVRWLETLDEIAGVYPDLERPADGAAFSDFPDGLREEARRWTEQLHRIGVVVPFLPVLLAARVKLTPADYVRMAQLCERFAFRAYRLGERKANAGVNDLIRAGHQVYRGDWSVQEACNHIAWHGNRLCDDKRVDRRLADGNFYHWSGIRYLLFEYEAHLLTKARLSPKVSWQALTQKAKKTTIEHILPQTPDRKYWKKRFSKSERKELVHDLGNLVLTENNSSYSNKAFPDKCGAAGSKKPCYATSRLLQEQGLSRLGAWTPDEVHKRRALLTAWVVERWALGGTLVFGEE